MIKPTEVLGDIKKTSVVCDNSECGHGYTLTTKIEDPMPHSDAIVRQGAAQRGWGQTVGGFDLCQHCAPHWTPEDDAQEIKPAKAAPKRVDYGNGVWGWSHRIAGPTRTGTGDE